MILKPIGTMKTCFDEKFAIPRQSGLIPSSYGHICLEKEYAREEALLGLESFSHIVLTWYSHKANPKLSVRPPRLGGNKKMGVFATRSPFRPNQICTSIVKLEKIENYKVYFSNHDILNETPLLDIRPYIPQWDCLPEANSGWLEDDTEELTVDFLCSVSAELKLLLKEVLRLNPLPRYKNSRSEYGFKVSKHEIKIRFIPDYGFEVLAVDPVSTER